MSTLWTRRPIVTVRRLCAESSYSDWLQQLRAQDVAFCVMFFALQVINGEGWATQTIAGKPAHLAAAGCVRLPGWTNDGTIVRCLQVKAR